MTSRLQSRLWRRCWFSGAGSLTADPAGGQLGGVLRTTFFVGVSAQEAAAERLGLPVSTYRRHLTRGIEELIELLWGQELYGAEQRLVCCVSLPAGGRRFGSGGRLVWSVLDELGVE
jgi:hypothetical protein